MSTKQKHKWVVKYQKAIKNVKRTEDLRNTPSKHWFEAHYKTLMSGFHIRRNKKNENKN